MKRFTSLLLLVLVVLLSACASSTPENSSSAENSTLSVSGGEINKAYTRTDLEGLTSSRATFNDVAYVGISISTLLQDAGFNLNDVKAVKAVATDGFSANYDASQALAATVIVAYARADGDLAQEDGAFRIVMPGAEGKLNVRMLAELQVIN